MRATIPPGDDAARLDFDDIPAVEAFFSQVKDQMGFFVELDRELKQYQRVTFSAVAPPRFDFQFEAEVIQVFSGPNGVGTAFQLCWQPGQSEELDRKLKGRDEVDDPSVSSPLFRIRNMNPNERFRLATKASRTERQILLRDNSPQVLLGLLAHPRLEAKEVLELLKSPHATGAMMERVANNRQWIANPEIQLLIVRSPKTSPPLAIKLLETCRTQDLRMLAKGSSSREQVRQAALRVYLKRTGQKK